MAICLYKCKRCFVFALELGILNLGYLETLYLQKSDLLANIQYSSISAEIFIVLVKMSKFLKLLSKVLSGTADSNLSFDELCRLVSNLGFEERIRGSHHIFSKEGIEEIVNLQPQGNNAKPYQVKQIRNIILKYKLGDNL